MNGREDGTMREAIEQRLYELIGTFGDQPINCSVESEVRRMLHIILSESIQAMEFVIAIENEFEIEFDDEDISIQFFLDPDHIIQSVLRGLARTEADGLTSSSAVT